MSACPIYSEMKKTARKASSMATEFRNLSIVCPVCHKRGNFPVFEMLDLVESSESTRSMVRSGKAFLFTCQSCGHKEPVTYPLSCFDDQHDAVITVLDTDNKVTDYKRIYKMYVSHGGDPSEKYRICDSCQEMSEKLRIYDDNLDDRIIELIKMLIRSEIAEEVEDFDAIKCTYKCLSHGKMFFSVRFYGEKEDVELPTSIYADVENTFNRLDDDAGLKNSFMINYTWADKMAALFVDQAKIG